MFQAFHPGWFNQEGLATSNLLLYSARHMDLYTCTWCREPTWGKWQLVHQLHSSSCLAIYGLLTCWWCIRYPQCSCHPRSTQGNSNSLCQHLFLHEHKQKSTERAQAAQANSCCLPHNTVCLFLSEKAMWLLPCFFLLPKCMKVFVSLLNPTFIWEDSLGSVLLLLAANLINTLKPCRKRISNLGPSASSPKILYAFASASHYSRWLHA